MVVFDLSPAFFYDKGSFTPAFYTFYSTGMGIPKSEHIALRATVTFEKMPS